MADSTAKSTAKDRALQGIEHSAHPFSPGVFTLQGTQASKRQRIKNMCKMGAKATDQEIGRHRPETPVEIDLLKVISSPNADVPGGPPRRETGQAGYPNARPERNAGCATGHVA